MFPYRSFSAFWKTAKVSPIPKKNSNLEVSNYRPNAISSNINSIFEKLVDSRLLEFLEEKNGLHYKQFGLRNDFSKNHAVLNLLESIQNTLNDGQIACGIFIGLEIAFDTVSHADDVCLLNFNDLVNKINKVVKKDLKFLDQRLNVNRISLNILYVAKTEIVIFRRKENQLAEFRTMLKKLKPLNYVRYLSIYITRK